MQGHAGGAAALWVAGWRAVCVCVGGVGGSSTQTTVRTPGKNTLTASFI